MIVKEFQEIFEQSVRHRAEHQCGGIPYEYGDVLSALVTATQSKRILELGTGLGYTAACLVGGLSETHVDTIDRDASHAEMAKKNWVKVGLTDQITLFEEKAEIVLPELTKQYDLIFFDGHVPSMKFLMQFERLLTKGGLLITANLFLRDKTGGKYVRAITKRHRFTTGVFADTAISVKMF